MSRHSLLRTSHGIPSEEVDNLFRRLVSDISVTHADPGAWYYALTHLAGRIRDDPVLGGQSTYDRKKICGAALQLMNATLEAYPAQEALGDARVPLPAPPASVETAGPSNGSGDREASVVGTGGEV
jgi:hypothetical protein